MEYRNIGKSDLKVSLAGLGCNNFSGRIDFDTSRLVIEEALEHGINFFDTADVYGGKGGSEEFLGKILGPKRKKIILATKFGMPMNESETLSGASRAYIFKAVEDSLKRLNTDWIDLYQVHRPDIDVSSEETMRALSDLVSQGKVRYLGCSNYSSVQLKDAQQIFDSFESKQFISSQDEYSLLVREIENELIPSLESLNMGLIPYFPIASGLLSGKYSQLKSFPNNSRFAAWPQLAERYTTKKNWSTINILEIFCKKNNLKLLDVALGWLASKPFVSSIIAGATSADQVRENINSLEKKLSKDEIKEIEKILDEESK